MTMILDRARGCLWGLAVGDAVGTTREFSSPAQPGERQTDMVGGGPFDLEPGQVTDDTQMAVCLAESLVACGKYDVDEVARRYVEWSRHAFDIGGTTALALKCVEAGTPVDRSGGRDENSKGNGALMRVAPLAVWHAKNALIIVAGRNELRRDAIADARITHASAECVVANVAYTAALFHALTQQRATPDTTIAAARRVLREIRRDVIRERVAASLREIRRDVIRERVAASLLYDLELATEGAPSVGRGGYVRDTFQLAFWELMQGHTHAEAVLDCTNRGGDTDTNAAVAGALIGAVYGMDKICTRWIETVANACCDVPLWGNEYHPRRLFKMLA